MSRKGRKEPRKPRGSQGSFPGGELGSVRERDATLARVKGLPRESGGDPPGQPEAVPAQEGTTPGGQPRAGTRSVPGAPEISQLPGKLPVQEGKAVIPGRLAGAANEALIMTERERRGQPSHQAGEPGIPPLARRFIEDSGSRLPGGGEIQPGSKAWRPDPREPLSSVRASTGPSLIITDDLSAIDPVGTDLVIEDLDPDDPDDSGRVLTGTPAQVRAYHDHVAELDRRAGRLRAGGGSAPQAQADAEAIRLRDRWTADEVLSQHAWLTHHYRNPAEPLADYLAFLMRNGVRQDHRVQSMYWPVDLPGGLADRPQGRQLAQLIARGLGEAATFQVTAPMCRKMRGEWEAAPPASLVLDEGELPAPAGFAWLDAPWLTWLAAGYWLPVRAVSWERTIVRARSSQDAYGLPDTAAGGMLDSARLVLWLAVADDVAFGRWDSETRAEKAAVQVGRLVPMQVALLPFGAHASTGGRPPTNGESLLSLTCTLWRYLGTMLPRSRPVRASAPAVARRVRASLRHGEVHIITLREYDYVSDGSPAGFPKKTDWKSRWWVEEFNRHIDRYDDGTDEKGRRRRHEAVPAQRTGYVTDDDHDICAVCLANGQVARITPVRGFFKGPAGKPLRTPAQGRTVYKLAR